MAKKSLINRDIKRKALVEKYRDKRVALKEALLNPELDADERQELHAKLQALPRNSSRTRVRNRCWQTGRSRGYFRDFGLSRNSLREMAHDGLLPGITKSSW